MGRRIDAHHHLWRYTAKDYGWIDGSMLLLQRNYTAADLSDVMASARIDGTIAVQAQQDVEETHGLLSLAEAYPFIEGVVGWAPIAGKDFPGWDACFANDVPTSQAKVLAVIQRPLALEAFTQPSGPPAWKTIPSWSLIGKQDHAIPPAELEFMAKRAHAKKIVHVKAGHLSMVSDPKAVANLIVDAAKSS